MRNFKKFLALVLAMLMVVSAAATVSAFSDVAEDNQYAAAIADLVEKEIVNGVGDDKFNPDGSVERYQMALMMARALDPDKTNEEWRKDFLSPFSGFVRTANPFPSDPVPQVVGIKTNGNALSLCNLL